MKRRAIIFILTVLLLITAFSCKQKRNEEKTVVRDAVSYSNAIWKCLTQKDYYIAQRGDNNIKTDFWILFDGPFGKEIQLTGYNPEFEMTGRLIGFNKFLLKGHYADELGRMYIGGKPYRYFFVEEWEIISPIKRLDETPGESLSDAIDIYDVEKGNYFNDVFKDRVGLGFADPILDGFVEGIIATVRNENGSFKWYRFKNGNELEEIIVKGNSPQKYLSEVFLNDHNYFVLFGNETEDQAYLCDDWGFLFLSRQYNEEIVKQNHSSFYFDALDVANGDYYPNGDSPLGEEIRQSP